MSHLTVFVLDDRRLHIQLDRDASRVPAPPTRMVRHWRPTTVAEDVTTTSVIEALAQAVRCQSPRAAIATLDSAWHLGLVDERGVADVFARLPSRYRPLRALLDPRAESGIETLVRLMLRQLGYDAELQVPLQDVGFVDLLVDGWLIVECDGAAHHRSWEEHKRDRRRDALAIAQGYTTIRLLAEDVLFRPEWVRDILRGALASRAQHSGTRRTSRPKAPPGSGSTERFRSPAPGPGMQTTTAEVSGRSPHRSVR
ncbi:endonuclease domain-containing protein [Microbacterium sp. TNHR37B]|uniref:endonuclease domain-containing protein n=1 Tax=Microbacterium sp. TNHR37B TaxID=1775956 RepID=UPI001E3DAFC6|nr:DUF559 domain-containing protein [Microbacterium sp. TNHR37B]